MCPSPGSRFSPPPLRGCQRIVLGFAVCLGLAAAGARGFAAESAADRMLAKYFQEETTRLATNAFADIKALNDWRSRRARYREELQEMFGLSPWPEKTELQATITRRIEREDFVVENLHYQALPGLYATGNLYLPKNPAGKVPAILYVCGHANVKEGGISYGAKANYQHHGAWLARHGYVCLVLDTIQLGELEGLHHGTYRQGMWWWNARGYTPGGVEAWNSIRALDYLQSRPEVDPAKLGMTGRSGGGAYTWATAALDERVRVAVPVAGITDLQNYVVDGCVAGHCDCMFIVNTYRWDYAKLAALIAPRPLLISNTDKDAIFPLNGVQRVHQAVKSIYALYNAADKLGLLITEGPHKDTQDLQVPALRWFNRFLKGEEPLIRIPAEKLLAPRELKVFETLPADQRTTTIHQSFVPLAAPPVPSDAAAWSRQRTAWLENLRKKTFGGWPAATEPLAVAQTASKGYDGFLVATWEFRSQGDIRLPLLVVAPTAPATRRAATELHLHVLDETDWKALNLVLNSPRARSSASIFRTALPPTLQALHTRMEQGEIVLGFLPPRGIGPTAPSGNERDHVQIRRRFMLLGQTLDGMRVWDIRRAIETLRLPDIAGHLPLHLHGSRHQAINALYASLFTEGISSLELIAPPVSHASGPDYLNVLRFLDIPQAAAMAVERLPVKWTNASPEAWTWTTQTARKLGWPGERLRW